MTTTNTPADLASLSKEELIRRLQAKEVSTGYIKVAAKGGVSLYGLGRHPVTLYRSQWEYLFGKVEEVKAFIEANKALLTEKPIDPKKEKAA